MWSACNMLMSSFLPLIMYDVLWFWFLCYSVLAVDLCCYRKVIQDLFYEVLSCFLLGNLWRSVLPSFFRYWFVMLMIDGSCMGYANISINLIDSWMRQNLTVFPLIPMPVSLCHYFLTFCKVNILFTWIGTNFKGIWTF